MENGNVMAAMFLFMGVLFGAVIASVLDMRTTLSEVKVDIAVIQKCMELRIENCF